MGEISYFVGADKPQPSIVGGEELIVRGSAIRPADNQH